MITKLKSILVAPLVLSLALLSFGGVAFAQNVYGSAVIDADVDTSPEDSANGSDGSAASADDGSMDQGSGAASVNLNAGGSLRLDRDDAKVENSTAGSASADTVNTDGDLESYAAATLRDHESLENVDVTEDHVSLSFKEDARLFGFIPLTMTSRLMADANGNVTIVRPWYSFMVMGTTERSTTDLKARVQAILSSAKTEDGHLTTRGQAVLMHELTLALGGSSATVGTDASAGTMLDTNTSTDDTTVDQGSGEPVAPQ